MKVHTDKDALLTAIKGVLPAVKKGPLPILRHIKVSAIGNQLEVEATDLDMSIQIRIPSEVEREGAVTLPAHDLLKVIAKLTRKDWISLELQDDNVSLTCGRTTLNLVTLPADDFPSMSLKWIEPIAIRTDDLLTAIRKVRFAAAKDDKSVISGALLEVKEHTVRMATTDGYRLATWSGESKSPGDFSAIIPRDALAALGRLLVIRNTRVAMVSAVDNWVVFDLGEVVFSTKAIDGQYPPYSQIIPKEFKHQATLPRAELLAAVTRMSIIADEREARTTKLHFQGEEVVLSASSHERGRGEDRLPVKGLAEETSIQFNATYLIEALRSFKSDQVNLLMNTPLAPACLTSSEDEGLFHLLMPIRA